ncbi:NAD-dependent epimerase/dehydratase family protein [Fulvivirgaceae bacterium PWU5]|uniref:NAD-dependent epimerase/dehydratase family protein n=1 Tax=Dawidia cretensis TaxID=2782350 RepID=A0AAP2DZV9_9BACT|nr:NAD-dependent epimerase/dehydratase family protein [Dawidia cretensis]MBT1708874.1 NAD-dependent epimerase/dehydratase family protein [Dawidia cretensis]
MATTASNLRVIITGATGMVGEGVLHECLRNPNVEAVLVINRKPGGVTHPKLREIIHGDFYNLSSIQDQLGGYDACYFCLGVSVIGLSEAEYFKITHTLTLHVADILSTRNPQMTFCYVSGASTDSTEQGRTMWARIKGKTENDLMKLPFRQVFAYRPGFMKPDKGAKNVLTLYKFMGWMYPIGRALFPKAFITLRELGLSMIDVTRRGYDKKILEVSDIVATAARANGNKI